MTRYVAFLRGINLGPNRRVAMKDLRRVLEEAGYAGVRTHLQSGNVVLSSDAAPEQLGRDLAATLRDAFGMDIAVVVRTRDELADVVARDPFGDEATDPALYQVTFLSDEPERERVEALERADVAPERVAVSGREVYAWHPNGVARSELATLISAQRLGVEATARNWRTVVKLLEMADEDG
jgi:uncharacterized protein (DUF1697 family)